MIKIRETFRLMEIFGMRFPINIYKHAVGYNFNYVFT